MKMGYSGGKEKLNIKFFSPFRFFLNKKSFIFRQYFKYPPPQEKNY